MFGFCNMIPGVRKRQLTQLLSPFYKFPGITYTQSGNLTYFDSTGTLQTAAVDTMVLDYDPSTLVLRGYPFWEARTNSIRNNTMVGASAPITFPTNWTGVQNGGTGITATVSIGTEDGIAYLDVALSGTPSGSGSYQVTLEPVASVAATSGQTWTNSAYLKLAAGSLTNIGAVRFTTAEWTSAPTFIQNNQSVLSSPTAAALRTQRLSASVTLSGGTTASIVPSITLTLTSGQAISLTLRIGLPQLELGAFATPVILTTTAAVTRAAPSCAITGTSFSSFWNQLAGTLVVSAMSGAATPAATFPILVRADDGTSNNRISIEGSPTSSRYYFVGVNGGVAQWDIDSASSTYNTIALSVFKRACTYAANNIAVSASGAAVGTDGSASIPTVTRITIGAAFNGWASSLLYYGARLPDASLVSLST